jgi:hypothetical protein
VPTPALKLLTKVFISWQKNPGCDRKITLPISKKRGGEYYETTRPDDKDQLHACLQNAELDGCVELEWGKYHDSHLLKRIILKNGPLLAKFLNTPLATDVAQGATNSLFQLIPKELEWVKGVANLIIEKWSKGEPAYRFELGETKEASTFIKALIAVSEKRQQGLDLRTFSAKVLNDSKAMERLKDRFTKAWNDQFDTGLDANELYESLGLMKFPPAVYLKGPCKVKVGPRWLDISTVPSYIGIPPDAIAAIEFSETPDYVMTIENLASFNRHTREINDKGLIIYSAGFLGPNTAMVLKMVDRALPRVNFYHWGDIDVGGLVIASHVQSVISKKLQLHLMTTDILDDFGKAVDKISVRRVAGLIENEEISHLAHGLLLNCPPKIVEQETLDPQSPLLA